jgi:hypothetical protein
MGSDGISMGFLWDFIGCYWASINLGKFQWDFNGILFQWALMGSNETFWKDDRDDHPITASGQSSLAVLFVTFCHSMERYLPYFYHQKSLVPTGWCPRIRDVVSLVNISPHENYSSLYISTINHRFQALFVRRFGSRELDWGPHPAGLLFCSRFGQKSHGAFGPTAGAVSCGSGGALCAAISGWALRWAVLKTPGVNERGFLSITINNKESGKLNHQQ